jgi:hypothetical protein
MNFPSGLLGRIQSKTARLNQQLTSQTDQYLQKMARREEKMRQKLAGKDSAAGAKLFASSSQQYKALMQKMAADTGSRRLTTSGVYQPYVDSLQGTLAFLKKNPQFLNNGTSPQVQAQLQGATSQLQTLQAKMQDASQVKTFIQQRKQQIRQYITQHEDVQGLLGKQYAGMNQDVYYYSQQVNQYKAMLNDPSQLELKALSLLNTLPAFQTFMKNNSQLSGLFNLPGSGAPAQALAGLQTRDQITQQMQGHLSAAGSGSGGMESMQSSVQSAQSELDNYKSKINQLGAGNTAGDVPDFRPNDQKTKTLWRRLEYGVNFQTSHNNYYYPIVTDFGLSLGYKLGRGNVVGVGTSYKLGWGSGINHIALSNEGVGLRSFVQIALKGSFSATGGFEYNYTTPFTSYQQIKQLQYWTKSGLIGVSKTVSMKSKVFKKTQVQLLWDFLSYQQVPKTQAVLFRVGYTF